MRSSVASTAAVKRCGSLDSTCASICPEGDPGSTGAPPKVGASLFLLSPLSLSFSFDEAEAATRRRRVVRRKGPANRKDDPEEKEDDDTERAAVVVVVVRKEAAARWLARGWTRRVVGKGQVAERADDAEGTQPILLEVVKPRGAASAWWAEGATAESIML
jgi:hypothetical protein